MSSPRSCEGEDSIGAREVAFDQAREIHSSPMSSDYTDGKTLRIHISAEFLVYQETNVGSLKCCIANALGTLPGVKLQSLLVE